MTVSSVVSLPVRKARANKPKTVKAPRINHRAVMRERVALGVLAAVALLTLVLGVTFLAEGITLATGASPWQAWASAIMVDLLVVACEAIALCATTDARRRDAHRLGLPLVAASLILSGALNVLAHLAHAPDTLIGQGSAIAIGLFFPAAYMGLSRLLARMTR